MANQRQVNILKKGFNHWNSWRRARPQQLIDLRNVDLHAAYIPSIHLYDANLNEATLSEANCSNADFRYATLYDANLYKGNFRGAVLTGANITGADLGYTNFAYADLSRANFYDANLEGANLTGANLNGASFLHANLTNVNLDNAILGWTIFGDLDLRVLNGLKTLQHEGPSPISINTIFQSQGKLSEIFLRNTGVPDIFIEYIHAFTNQPINYYTCFISYSSKDAFFVQRLHADLQAQGVRCWFAPHDMKIGDKIRVRIDESIRLYDKLLLVLSKHSVASDWVEHEVEMALAKEQREKRAVLFPIRLDTAIFEQGHSGWPALIQHQRHIGNFTCWKDYDHYQVTFDRLLHDLQV
ncbi:toll/interleukin-1 receptor domain-containing protein [Ktedonospora formicarum]|uniref:TIR domain-containing protein n=1 Tax=Ktedonospora formicarum TaxID=2778364 RepID=A0A8J3MXH3_9CHLR|nr:toll/interleukin-1 receptor domain-containing protein [Ktedonospora formicarum]GHO48560.1 hypothetical protein KSX_67230 [Ktedonospora formicarum]